MRPRGLPLTFEAPTTTLAKEGAMKLSDPRHFRRLAGASLVLAPLLLLASSAVSPALKSDEGAQLAVVARPPDRFYLFSMLGLVTTIVLVPALLVGSSAVLLPALAWIGAIALTESDERGEHTPELARARPAASAH